ncbi:MAG: PAS domain S-box protein [Deltaproteobacteria bacterium]|nr:PAS domain S-box protein [Deltaproteobacteria bacterium]
MPWAHTSKNHQDRKLALSFGAIVLLLMLALFSIAGHLFTQLYEKEEDRLSSMLATIFADSIAKVSFSGKYHTRLFVEEIQDRIPALAFISVEDKEGKIIAHSRSAENDTYLQAQESTKLRDRSLAGDTIVSADRVCDGQIIKEVVSPYRSELDNELMGVVRIGIKMDEVHKEQRKTIVRMIILIVILTMMAIGGILLLSRHFGDAHRILAAQLRGILAYTPLLMTITNQDGRLLDCSKQCEKLFGPLSDQQTLKQYLENHLSFVDIQRLSEANDAIFATGQAVELELEVELHGQKRIWHISKFAIAHDVHGRPSLICTFVHDITERKQAEKNVTAAKEQWERTFDAIADIITIHDPDMRIVKANQAAGKMFQTAPEALIGRFCYDVFCDASAPCPGCPELQSRHDQGHHQAVIHHRKLGKAFEVASFPIVDNGRLSGFVHIAKDITKSLMLEEQLRQSQKLEAIGTLAGGIAHDFNNILTPILGYAEMALIDIDPSSVLAQELQQICAAAGRAKDLVQQILGFSRRGPQDKKPFHPHLVVKEVLKLLRSSLPSTIEFKTDIDDDCGTILADSTQFHQIIMNLCTNAYHAMEKTGGILGLGLSRVAIDKNDHKVASSELMPGDYIMLSVSDTGYGMDRRTLERIFEPYFTTKANGKGTGLGLSVVHGIVKSYGGQIGVYSEPTARARPSASTCPGRSTSRCLTR